MVVKQRVLLVYFQQLFLFMRQEIQLSQGIQNFMSKLAAENLFVLVVNVDYELMFWILQADGDTSHDIKFDASVEAFSSESGLLESVQCFICNE